MTFKAQSANPTPAEADDGLDESYYTDLLKMKLDNAVWVEPQLCLHTLFSQSHVLMQCKHIKFTKYFRSYKNKLALKDTQRKEV